MLDPYKAIIDDKLEFGCSAMSIYKFIQTKGYPGKYGIVKLYCHSRKKEKLKKATIRVEHTPGLSAQVDLKENITLMSSQGELIKFNIFLYVLPYSKKKYITLTFDRKQDTLFQCLKEAFDYTGGVPHEIWFDNMKTVIDRSRSQFNRVHFNDRFYAFSKDAGFTPISCRAFRPQSKGSVEALARTMERLKVYNGEFENEIELINIVKQLDEDLNNEISQATNQIPNDLWKAKEKEHLRPTSDKVLAPYFEDDNISRIVSKEAMVLFRKCKYSVSPKYIGCEVELKVDYAKNIVEIYYNGELIRYHNLTDKALNYNHDDIIEILKSDLYPNKDDDELEDYIRSSLNEYDV